MLRFILFILILPKFIFGSWGDLFNREDDPIIYQNVNVLNGKLQLAFTDHVVQGAVPLALNRSYTNFNVTKKKHARWQFTEGWSFFSHTHLYLDVSAEKLTAQIVEPSGSLATYKRINREKNIIFLEPETQKDQNSEIMSYRYNPENNRLSIDKKTKTATLYLADGGKRLYKLHKRPTFSIHTIVKDLKGLGSEYLLDHEISSSGSRTSYSYSEEGEKLVVKKTNPSGTKVFSEITINQTHNYPNFKITATTSDKKEINYFGTALKKRCHLRSITREDRPSEMIDYEYDKTLKKHWLTGISTPERDELFIEYNLPEYTRIKGGKSINSSGESYKVKTISRLGKVLANFEYFENGTELRNREGILTRYHHEDGTLNRIEHFDEEDILRSAEVFIWEDGNLKEKIYEDSQGETLFTKSFEYDSYKNVIKETIHGDLSGQKQIESYSKQYKYNNRHLCVEEKEETGLTYQYKYVNGTDLLLYKKTLDRENTLMEEFYTYNEDLLLVKKRCYDGFHESIESYIRDSETGMIVETYDGLNNNHYEYDDANRVILETVNGVSVSSEYDLAGRLTKKTFPLGESNSYSYDEYGNIITAKEIGSPEKEFKYNKDNLPIVCRQHERESRNIYDNTGKLLVEENYKGIKTSFSYDKFGSCVKKQLTRVQDDNGEWYHPEIFYEYDVRGNVVLQTSDGRSVKTEYNIFNQPTKITYANGTSIQNVYYKNGELKETTLQDGTKTYYEYDSLNRLTLKRTQNFEEKWKYQGAYLNSYTDARELKTIYHYDEFGRKISEECEGRKRAFTYDERGNLFQVTNGETTLTRLYDLEGRVIEVSENGFNTICYEYDEEGRKSTARKTTSAGEALDQFFYDKDGRLCLHIDPLGEETKFIYEDFTRIEIDPLENATVEKFDGLSRIIQRENQSPDGEILLTEQFFYDRSGNLARRFTEDQEVVFTYDPIGRLLEQTESGQKTTSMFYDEKGRLCSKTKPDGTILTYEYDSLDRMKELKSSDSSVWYEYIHKDLDLIEIKDHISGKSLKRSYTKFGELAEEIGFSGFKTSWFYDTFGRTKEVVLPDNSSIAYTYRGGCVSSILRFDRGGNYQYKHTYTKYDANKHVEEEQLPFHLGSTFTKRDLLERAFKMTSSYHNIGMDFGPSSLVTKKTNSLTRDTDYAYDPLNQLTEENETSYNFDSLGNPKDDEVNELNQILATKDERFSYDENGNLVSRNDTIYSYDALDRLVCITYAEDRKVHFTYDPLSRLVSKETHDEKKLYLYNKDFEIGSMNTQGKIKELKILGLGIKGDIGATIAIEIDDKPYVPLHDLQGNIIGLVDEHCNLIEKYDYNAFGEDSSEDYINPWRYASKRAEEGLIFFGLRFYDPGLKRWISPDPAGFVDGGNLYLYVLNSPLNRLDQFGLEAEFLFRVPSHCYNDGICPNVNVGVNNYPYFDRNFQQGPTKFEGFGSFSGIQVDLMFICAREFEFQFTEHEIKQGYFNLMEHLHELIGGIADQIEFVTFQNGINNPHYDWENMGVLLNTELPRGVAAFGIHKPTNGAFKDGREVIYRKNTRESITAEGLAAFHTSLYSIMEKHAPDGKIQHFAHSGGVLEYNISVEKMNQDNRKLAQKYMDVQAFGGAECTPKDYAADAHNYYSDFDLITGGFASKDGGRYNVKILKAITPYKDRIFYIADHTFAGATYKKERESVIKKYHNKLGGYNVGNYR